MNSSLIVSSASSRDSTDLNGELALGISRYEPRASTVGDSYDHQGEEAGLVLEGQLELTKEDKKYLLEAGDSFSFKSQLKHRYANPSDLGKPLSSGRIHR